MLTTYASASLGACRSIFPRFPNIASKMGVDVLANAGGGQEGEDARIDPWGGILSIGVAGAVSPECGGRKTVRNRYAAIPNKYDPVDSHGSVQVRIEPPKDAAGTA